MKSFITKSAEETQNLAKKIAPLLRGGTVLGLIGDLGAGKTSFVQGLAEGLHLGPEHYVVSPTFTLLRVYPTKPRLHHFDLYRLENAAAFDDLGFEDVLREDGIVVIEWADKFPEMMPQEMMKITLEILGENKRKIVIPQALWNRSPHAYLGKSIQRARRA